MKESLSRTLAVPTSNAQESASLEPLVHRTVERWLLRRRKLARYIEFTVRLLQNEDYLAASVWTMGFDLVAVCPDHWLLAFVAKDQWPSVEETEIMRCVPLPPGTRKLIFRWHSLRGFPDRRQL